MQIISMPDNYQGAFSELIYTISEADPTQTVEVTILGEKDNDVMGIKRFRGNDRFTVNISNYMRRRAAVTPQTIAGCVATFVPERIVAGRIKVVGTVSPLRLFTSGVKSASELAPLSDKPVIAQLAAGEKDEIAMIVPSGKKVIFKGLLTTAAGIRKEVFTNTVTGNGQMVVQLIDSTEEGTLEVYIDGVLLQTYEIEGGRQNTVRLCWVNPYGAIDYYTFALCNAETLVAEKSRIYTESGYKVYDSAAQKVFTLQSEYENTHTMKWLEQILGSPKIWIACPDGYISVDVITDKMKISRMAPSSLRLEVRESMKTQFQNL